VKQTAFNLQRLDLV